MNSRDFKYFKIAKNISECSDFKQFHIGAVLVYKSDILSGTKAMARPCPACMKALIDLGVRDMFYTAEEGCCYERIG